MTIAGKLSKNETSLTSRVKRWATLKTRWNDYVEKCSAPPTMGFGAWWGRCWRGSCEHVRCWGWVNRTTAGSGNPLTVNRSPCDDEQRLPMLHPESSMTPSGWSSIPSCGLYPESGKRNQLSSSFQLLSSSGESPDWWCPVLSVIFRAPLTAAHRRWRQHYCCPGPQVSDDVRCWVTWCRNCSSPSPPPCLGRWSCSGPEGSCRIRGRTRRVYDCGVLGRFVSNWRSRRCWFSAWVPAPGTRAATEE